MSGKATLTWQSNVGFELDLTADLQDIRLRFAAVPVPADGSAELEEGVDLNKLDILFKCQAAIDGAPAQLQDAKIRVQERKLFLVAHLEDVENGLLYPLEVEVDCPMPRGAPERGGPRNTSPDEDDLDWDDETTFEAVVGDVPDAALLTEDADYDDDSEESEREAGPPKGLAALLAALKNLDGTPADDDADGAEDVEDDEEDDDDDGWVPPPAAPASPSDQKMSPVEEAVAFLTILEDRDEIELEEGFEIASLAHGVARILELPISDDAKAERLSAWLLDQEAVADLFIDDEDLAAIVAEW